MAAVSSELEQSLAAPEALNTLTPFRLKLHLVGQTAVTSEIVMPVLEGFPGPEVGLTKDAPPEEDVPVASAAFDHPALFEVNTYNCPAPARNPSGWGYLARKDGTKTLVPHTFDNDLLFMPDSKDQFKVEPQGSATVVGILQNLELIRGRNAPENKLPYQGSQVFFTNSGECYSFANLASFHESTVSNGRTVTKHTAVFRIPSKTEPGERELAIAIDDIYCITGMPHPNVYAEDSNQIYDNM
jgi:hypothetical protein